MAKKQKMKWYEKYLPFVARSQEMQFVWLVSALKKSVNDAGGRQGILTKEEIRPYIRLLLQADGNDFSKGSIFLPPERGKEGLAELFAQLDDQVMELMMEAADIYDVPKIIGLAPDPHVGYAVIALKKILPPYEKNAHLVLDRVFHSIHAYSPELLSAAVEKLRESDEVPDHFEPSYERFQEIIKDEQILSSLYPKAR
ncbi:MAG: hypothetical protein KKB30_07355 [Proteobacteria bacterium]|nr:hypothetical protein [Pseudomonadota bacterium]MBU1714961.1 hypothetical protein [Pseudomonadota bacterium]